MDALAQLKRRNRDALVAMLDSWIADAGGKRAVQFRAMRLAALNAAEINIDRMVADTETYRAAMMGEAEHGTS
jgi:hypothetical protein